MAKRRVSKKGRSKGGLKVHGGFKSVEHKMSRKRAPRKRA